MILDVHASRVVVSDSTKEYLTRRLEFSLGRFESAINSVSVTLADTNGPRGGVDKQCRLRIDIAGDKRPLIAEATEEELKTAIDVASDRATRLIAKHLDRRTSGRRAKVEAVLSEADAG